MNRLITDLFSLSGRTALITGGSSGIGNAIAGALALAGANVVLAARGPDRLQEAADRLRDSDCAVEVISADLGERDPVRRLAEHAAAERTLRSLARCCDPAVLKPIQTG